MEDLAPIFQKRISSITEIPGYEYYELMAYLYFRKEHCQNGTDYEKLESDTEEFIRIAEEQKKQNIVAVLYGHQSENIFCRKQVQI